MKSIRLHLHLHLFNIILFILILTMSSCKIQNNRQKSSSFDNLAEEESIYKNTEIPPIKRSIASIQTGEDNNRSIKRFQINPSDKLFSYRSVRLEGEANYINALENISKFKSTKLLWHYKTSSPKKQRFYTKIKAMNLPMQCALLTWATNPNEQCRDLYGDPVVPTWITNSASPLIGGDLIKNSFRNHWLAHAKSLAGQCHAFQQDNAQSNVSFLNSGGCFSSESNRGFQDYLKRNVSAKRLESLGIDPYNLDRFYYTAYLKKLNAPGGKAFKNWNHPKSLLEEYRKYTKVAVLDAYKKLKQSLPNHLLSMNFDKRDPWLFNASDFILKEYNHFKIQMEKNTSHEDIVKEFLRRNSYVMEKNQYIIQTLPHHNLYYNKLFYAILIALGQNFVLPWDVYTNWGEERVYHRPEDFYEIINLMNTKRNILKSNYMLYDVYSKIGNSFSSDLIHLEKLDKRSIVADVHVSYYPGGATTTISFHKKFLFPHIISKGHKITIEGVTRKTIAESRTGQMKLAGDYRSLIYKGARVDSIDGGSYFIRYSAIYGPKVVSVRYNSHKKITIVRFNSAFTPKVIPKNSTFKINNRTYTQSGLTGVGNVYLSGDRRKHILPNQRLQTFRRSNWRRTFKSSAKLNIKSRSVWSPNNNVIITVFKNPRQSSILSHISVVNADKNAVRKNITVYFDSKKIFGRNVAILKCSGGPHHNEVLRVYPSKTTNMSFVVIPQARYLSILQAR